MLGWFKRGYVDVTGSTWSTFPVRYVRPGDVLTTMTQAGVFSCNHMPIIEDDQTRKALAFMREGRRLRSVHEPYSFLSFFKVIESQFDSDDRKAWVARRRRGEARRATAASWAAVAGTNFRFES